MTIPLMNLMLCSELDLNWSLFLSCSLQFHGKAFVGKTLVCLGEVVATAQKWGQMEQAVAWQLRSSPKASWQWEKCQLRFSARLQKRSETPAVPA